MKADRFVMRPKLLAALASLTLLLVATGAAAQPAPNPTSYPEHGKVISTRLGAEAVGSAGIVGSLKRWVYRVDCGDLYYDLQGGGKPSLTVGQDVAFRIEKQKAYVDDGKNGKRYKIVGSGKSDQKQCSLTKLGRGLAGATASVTFVGYLPGSLEPREIWSSFARQDSRGRLSPRDYRWSA